MRYNYIQKKLYDNNTIFVGKYNYVTGVFCMSNIVCITAYSRRENVIKIVELSIFIIYIMILY